MITKKQWYVSSANPLELSLTIKGLLMFYVPATLELAQKLNFPMTNNVLTDYVSIISLAIALFMTIYGGLRRLINWCKKNFR